MVAIMGGLLIYAGVAIAVVIAIGLLLLYQGWAIWMLWGWFVVPFGAPQITVAWAMGLCILLNSVRLKANPFKHEEVEGWQDFVWLLQPLAAVGFGWCVKQFM